MTMIMNLKRKRSEENQEKQRIDIATTLMLLSQEIKPQPQKIASGSLEFSCKTCDRKFSSFQALGGHRASHKKPKLAGEEIRSSDPKSEKPKMHACSICGQEFALGQALGGHMRRHRGGGGGEEQGLQFPSPVKFSHHGDAIAVKSVPVLKRSNSKRVMSLQMDLNLTPLENDLKILFGNKAPRVDLSLF